MKELKKIKLSILDLAIVTDNNTVGDTLQHSKRMAQLCDELGYERFWMAEHHNMEHIASSATSVLLGFIAANTQNIRVGSGGVMLPNHAPLVIAEQFGTLESLYPGRIDLGLGRAPGSDTETAMAIRADFFTQTKRFPENVVQLQRYLSNDNKDSKVRAFPGEGTNVPIWILGSSTDSAMLAAHYGLPYAFAGHFAPTMMMEAFARYKANYRPNAINPEPYTMACVNAIAADTVEEAELLATSMYQNFLNIIRNIRKPMQAPVPNLLATMSEMERLHVLQMLSCSFIGGKERIQNQLGAFIENTGIDELMITAHIYDVQARLYSAQLMHEVVQALNNLPA